MVGEARQAWGLELAVGGLVLPVLGALQVRMRGRGGANETCRRKEGEG